VQGKFRVVYLADKLDLSGTPLQIVELARHLDRKRFQPHFVVLSFVDEKIRAQLEKNEIGFEALGRGNWVKAEAWRDLRKLHRLFRQHRPDVVHAYLATSNVLAALVGALARVPVTISSHRDLGGFDGKWITRLNHWTDRRLIDCVTVNGGAVREALAKRSGLAAEAIAILYNGVDLEKINHANRRDAKRTELGLRPEDFAIALIANFHPAKGHRYLIEAFNRLARRFPNARLLLCGYCNDTPLLNALRELVIAAGVEKQVWFMGSRSDIPEIMHAIDVLAAPSLSEGFSNSILEALAAGKPVVASRVGGNVEQISDGVNGFLVPPADSAALAIALERLLSSPAQHRQMGEAAQTRVQQRFSIEKMVEAHQQLYNRLLQRRYRHSTTPDFQTCRKLRLFKQY
jgi:glycosyltransferase involved in cell wall biosynthesis